MTLDDLLAECLRATPDVQKLGSEWARNGVVFAARPGLNEVELRLGAELADAALRTPNTSASPRGGDWVRLATADWADATDRLEAWYRVAWRLAGKR